MAKKLWGGRFKKSMHPLLLEYSESISFDKELAFVDIKGSLAHAEMLKKVRIISAKDFAAIKKGLLAIEKKIRTGKFTYKLENEDIHMAIESALTDSIGDPARKLHTARSRNDQVATDFRLWARDAVDDIVKVIESFQKELVKIADKNKELVIAGYTHLQRAQPVLIAQHLLAYAEMLQRDKDRLLDCRKRINCLPLGACALAGTTLPVDREFVRKKLGFDKLCENSMDAVSDRDFCVELVAALSLIMTHTSRFSEDIILWASTEWGLLKLADEWSTGSSIMPQKRNPDLLELVRGKTGRVHGSLMALLTIIKGLPMTYNRDLQEDKPQVFDAVKTVQATLNALAEFTKTIKFNKPAADKMLDGGFLEATVMAEYLVEKGLPFRKAHEASGELVRLAEERDCRLKDIKLTEMKTICKLFSQDIYKRLDPALAVKHYKSASSAGTKEVAKSLAKWRKKLINKK